MTRLVFLKILLILCCASFMGNGYTFGQFPGDKSMFSSSKNNLDGIEFNERAHVEKITDELANAANNPYAASLPLIASATLGDRNRYERTLTLMMDQINDLEVSPDKFDTWMRSSSFKAWMWGRVLLAAKSMNDDKTMKTANEKLVQYLAGTMNQNDNPAFFTWTWGYRAALNQAEYQNSVGKMMQGAAQLSTKYKADPSNHDALSDALWAWVMNLSAAANAHDQERYETIKQQIIILTIKNSISDALEFGLLRTEQSNDYPAWALAKVRLAAAIMKDREVFQDIDHALVASVNGASGSQIVSAKSEYILSVLEGELAKLAGNELQVKLSPRK